MKLRGNLNLFAVIIEFDIDRFYRPGVLQFCIGHLFLVIS